MLIFNPRNGKPRLFVASSQKGGVFGAEEGKAQGSVVARPSSAEIQNEPLPRLEYVKLCDADSLADHRRVR